MRAVSHNSTTVPGGIAWHGSAGYRPIRGRGNRRLCRRYEPVVIDAGDRACRRHGRLPGLW
eukprot:889235-Amorphochlora_amoeboformis.AAC.1